MAKRAKRRRLNSSHGCVRRDPEPQFQAALSKPDEEATEPNPSRSANGDLNHNPRSQAKQPQLDLTNPYRAHAYVLGRATVDVLRLLNSDIVTTQGVRTKNLPISRLWPAILRLIAQLFVSARSVAIMLAKMLRMGATITPEIAVLTPAGYLASAQKGLLISEHHAASNLVALCGVFRAMELASNWAEGERGVAANRHWARAQYAFERFEAAWDKLVASTDGGEGKGVGRMADDFGEIGVMDEAREGEVGLGWVGKTVQAAAQKVVDKLEGREVKRGRVWIGGVIQDPGVLNLPRRRKRLRSRNAYIDK
eukprot:1365913-Amorphochlora_amoeboformis.AAC.1